MGEFAQVRKRLEPALNLSGQPVRRGTMAHKHAVYMMLVENAAIENDESDIIKYAPLLEEIAIRDNHQPYLAIAYRSYGVFHKLKQEFDKADTKLQQALEIFEDLGMVWQKGRTLFELGELARKMDKAAQAEQLFSQALAIFEGLKAKPNVEITKSALENVKT
jgi:tetratricopeptide (TPR) repeat protein